MADLRTEHLDLTAPAKVHLHGKADKWRICPLWKETVEHIERLLTERLVSRGEAVFCGRGNRPLTRFGIYKIVRRHGASWDTTGPQLTRDKQGENSASIKMRKLVRAGGFRA